MISRRHTFRAHYPGSEMLGPWGVQSERLGSTGTTKDEVSSPFRVDGQSLHANEGLDEVSQVPCSLLVAYKVTVVARYGVYAASAAASSVPGTLLINNFCPCATVSAFTFASHLARHIFGSSAPPFVHHCWSEWTEHLMSLSRCLLQPREGI